MTGSDCYYSSLGQYVKRLAVHYTFGFRTNATTNPRPGTLNPSHLLPPIGIPADGDEGKESPSDSIGCYSLLFVDDQHSPEKKPDLLGEVYGESPRWAWAVVVVCLFNGIGLLNLGHAVPIIFGVLFLLAGVLLTVDKIRLYVRAIRAKEKLPFFLGGIAAQLIVGTFLVSVGLDENGVMALAIGPGTFLLLAAVASTAYQFIILHRAKEKLPFGWGGVAGQLIAGAFLVFIGQGEEMPLLIGVGAFLLLTAVVSANYKGTFP